MVGGWWREGGGRVFLKEGSGRVLVEGRWWKDVGGGKVVEGCWWR